MNRITSVIYDARIGLAKCVRIAAILAVLLGIYTLWTYSLPMFAGSYEYAADSMSPAAERAVSMYDAGLQRYQAKDYKGAVKVLTEAYNATLGPQGVVEGDQRKFASDIKFLTGNALVQDKQLGQAVEAYKDALRLDPNNLYAKYNLEMLQQMNGGKGPGEGDGDGDGKGNQPPGNGAPGKGIKKGI